MARDKKFRWIADMALETLKVEHMKFRLQRDDLILLLIALGEDGVHYSEDGRPVAIEMEPVGGRSNGLKPTKLSIVWKKGVPTIGVKARQYLRGRYAKHATHLDGRS